jgi:hypothetical protein
LVEKEEEGPFGLCRHDKLRAQGLWPRAVVRRSFSRTDEQQRLADSTTPHLSLIFQGRRRAFLSLLSYFYVSI